MELIINLMVELETEDLVVVVVLNKLHMVLVLQIKDMTEVLVVILEYTVLAVAVGLVV